MFVVSRQVAFYVIIALAQAVCLVVGGMNLSVGGSAASPRSSWGCAWTTGAAPVGWPLPWPLRWAPAGLLNGLLITRLKIDSFIVTMSMMFIYMGLRSGISGGAPYSGAGVVLRSSGSRDCSGVPYVFLIMLAVLLAVALHVPEHGVRPAHAGHRRQRSRRAPCPASTRQHDVWAERPVRPARRPGRRPVGVQARFGRAGNGRHVADRLLRRGHHRGHGP